MYDFYLDIHLYIFVLGYLYRWQTGKLQLLALGINKTGLWLSGDLRAGDHSVFPGVTTNFIKNNFYVLSFEREVVKL